MIRPRSGRFARATTKYVSHMDAKSVRARMNPATFDRLRKVSIVRNPWDREVSLYYWHTRNMKHPPNFSSFVKRWERNPERKTFNIYSIDGRVVANDIWRYERLSEDYTNFVQSLGVKDVPLLPRMKAAIRPKRERGYQSLYHDETRDVVARRYAHEIALFGYTFE